MQEKIDSAKDSFSSLEVLVETIQFPNNPISDRSPNEFPVIYKEDIKLIIMDIINKLDEIKLIAPWTDSEVGEIDRILAAVPKIHAGINLFKGFGNNQMSSKGLIISMISLQNILTRLNSILSFVRIKDTGILPRKIQSDLFSYKDKIKKIDTDFTLVDEKIKLIVQAYDASIKLPETKRSLDEADLEIKKIRDEAASNEEEIKRHVIESKSKSEEIDSYHESSKKTIEKIRNEFNNQSEELSKYYKEKIVSFEGDAKTLLDKCQEALRITTSYGLAGAFNDKANSLKNSIRLWVAALMVSLLIAGILGHSRLVSLEKIIQNGKLDSLTLTIEISLSIISLFAPLWFSWIATKQISQRFKLAEDYDYKASISKAYEGYRSESIELDNDFRERLFGNALTRLEEIPLRYVSNEDHSSPLMEIMNSPTIKDLLQKIGETPKSFIEKIINSKEQKEGDKTEEKKKNNPVEDDKKNEESENEAPKA